jgi:hypothetical protein
MNDRNEMQPQTGEPGRSGRVPAWARALLADSLTNPAMYAPSQQRWGWSCKKWKRTASRGR